MKKVSWMLFVASLILGTTALLAKTGVLIHEKDGKTIFIPSDELEYVEFVEDYEEEPTTPPSSDTDPSPENPSQPGDNNGENGDSDSSGSGSNDDNSGGDNGNSSENPDDNQGAGDNSGSQDNPGNTPDNPGSGNNSGNSGDDTGEEKPSTPPAPSNPGDSEDKGDNNQPENPEQPVDTSFHLYTGASLPLNETYLIVYNTVCASPLPATYTYGYLPSANISVSNNTVEGNENNGFVFTSSFTSEGKEYSAPSNKFMIKDSLGRYLYLSGTYNSFSLGEKPELNSDNAIADGYLFAASKSGNQWIITNTRGSDKRYVVYSSKYGNFAAYNSLSSTDFYPQLYIKGTEYTGESPENPGNSGNNGSNNSGNTDEVPSGYKYPLSYVKLPEGTPQQVKEYTSYTLNFNKNNHTANYVAWELLASETSGSVDRNKYSYWVDKDIEGCLSKDFAYSTYQYERGHLCPAADNKWSAEAMKDCMSMANMVPQLSSLNGKIWGTLEDKSRTWAKNLGSIWIVAGPVYYDSDNLYVGDAKARVPSACFKAFLYYDGVNSQAIAYVFQNGDNPGDMQGYAMSIDQLEKETGYDFFSALPDDIENVVESTFDANFWR